MYDYFPQRKNKIALFVVLALTLLAAATFAASAFSMIRSQNHFISAFSLFA